MSKHFSFFPKRILHAYPLESKKTLHLGLEDEETTDGPLDELEDDLTGEGESDDETTDGPLQRVADRLLNRG